MTCSHSLFVAKLPRGTVPYGIAHIRLSLGHPTLHEHPPRSASAPMPKPAMPPSSRFTERAVEMAPRLQPKVSANTGRNTPKAASGGKTPKVAGNSAATINHRRAAGRTLKLLPQRPDGILVSLDRKSVVG